MGELCAAATIDDHNSPDPWNFSITSFGLPRNRSHYANTGYTAEIGDFFQNGSLNVGSAHLELSDYCIDAQETLRHFVLVVSQRGSHLRIIQPLSFLFSFCTSLLLMAVTLTIYLAIPELRRKVHDKCFICYLAFLGSSALILGSFILTLYVAPHPRCLSCRKYH